MVPLLLMPVSVHLRRRAWASKPGRGGLRAGEDGKQGEGTPSRERVKGALLLGYSSEEELMEWLMHGALWHEADRDPDGDLAKAGGET